MRRPAAQLGNQVIELRRRSDGVDLDAAVGKIPDVPAHVDLLGGVTYKVAITDALHLSRHVDSPGLLSFRHSGLRDRIRGHEREILSKDLPPGGEKRRCARRA